MSSPGEDTAGGIVYTFYSFKGGVGRTMALANVSALLAKWGYSVLVVDWDLEAPGLERFYDSVNPDIHALRTKTPGIVDLIHSTANGEKLLWRDCVLSVSVPESSGQLSLLTAGRRDERYSARLQSLDFFELFDRQELGSYIEELRNDWIAEFDFVLLDSRTGVSDLGGICTVHLADVLILLFTTNESSTEGARQIVERARKAQDRLPLDRRRLLAVPIPARDESRTEYDNATHWHRRFAEEFGELYRDWLPSGTTAHEAIDQLRIPYIPHWSFGERLPVLEEGTSDRASLGHAYQILARILAARLDWYEALKGETLAPPPTRRRRELSGEWLERHRQAALEGLSASGLKGSMEVCHYSPDSQVSKSQLELLSAAKQAQVHTFGWPIGVVLDNREESRPRPTNEGILAKVSIEDALVRGRGFDYWTLTKSGDFYTLISLFEDERDQNRAGSAIYFDTRIVRATEALLHCTNLYEVMGFEPNAHIEMLVRYGGLRGRTLTAASPGRVLVEARGNIHEEEVSVPPITFTLGAVESEIVELVKKLCEPLFMIFDFEKFEDHVYQPIVTDFVRGRVT